MREGLCGGEGLHKQRKDEKGKKWKRTLRRK